MTLNPIKIYKQIAALLKIEKQGVLLMDTVKTEVKAGWKTSEFWFHILGIVVTIASAAAPLIPATAFPFIAVVANLAPMWYSRVRTIAKAVNYTPVVTTLDQLAATVAPLIDLNEVPASKP